MKAIKFVHRSGAPITPLPLVHAGLGLTHEIRDCSSRRTRTLLSYPAMRLILLQRDLGLLPQRAGLLYFPDLGRLLRRRLG